MEWRDLRRKAMALLAIAAIMFLAFMALLISAVVPFLLGRRWFLRKDF